MNKICAKWHWFYQYPFIKKGSIRVGMPAEKIKEFSKQRIEQFAAHLQTFFGSVASETAYEVLRECVDLMEFHYTIGTGTCVITSNAPVLYADGSCFGPMANHTHNYIVPENSHDQASRILDLALARAASLREKSRNAKIFDGKRMEYRCAAEEIEKLIEEIKAL